MSNEVSNEVDNNADLKKNTDAAQRLYSEVSGFITSVGDLAAKSQAEVERGFLPQFELISNTDQPSVLPDGMQGTLVRNYSFQSSEGWALGIQNTSGRGPNNVWDGDQGYKFSADAVEFRPAKPESFLGLPEPGGLYITANAINDGHGNTSGESTFGEISSLEPVGGDGEPYNGKPYYIEFTMSGSQDWPGVWLLPVDGAHGQKEIDLQEGNMPGNRQLDAAEQTLNSAYHWNFKDIRQQVLLVQDTRSPDDPPAPADPAYTPTLNNTLHTYGALIEGDRVTMYFDGKKMGVLQTDPDNLHVPMTIIIDNYVWPGSPGSADWHKDNVWGPTTMHMTNMRIYTIGDLPATS